MTDWQVYTLRDVLTAVDERVGAQDIELVLSVTEKRGILPQTEVFNKRIATTDVAKYKVLRPRDIAYNPYLLWTGAVGQWLGGEPGVTSPVYECFRVNPPHEPRFIGLLMESGLLTSYFDSTAVGSIQRRRRTTLPVFLAAEARLPDPDSQRRTADLIGSLDAQIEALSAETLRIAELHDALREDLLAGHAEVELGTLLRGIEAGRSPSTNGEAPRDGEPGVLKVSAVSPLEFHPSEAKALADASIMSPDMEVKPGDILITRANTPDRVGAVCRVAPDTRRGLYLSDKTLRLLPERGVDADFLAEALNRRSVRAHLTGTATGTSASMFNITQPKIRATLVPSLSLDKQRQVTESLTSVRQVAVTLRAEWSRARALRRVCLVSLLVGDVEIPASYDPLLGAL